MSGLAPRHKDLLDPFKTNLNDRIETADWRDHQEKHHLLSYRLRYSAAARLESSGDWMSSRQFAAGCGLVISSRIVTRPRGSLKVPWHSTTWVL